MSFMTTILQCVLDTISGVSDVQAAPPLKAYRTAVRSKQDFAVFVQSAVR